MTTSKRLNDQIKYSNRKKVNTDFKGKDLRRSNCFGCDFSNSQFDETSFRGAQFKSCNFSGCTFDGAELVAANLKKSSFKQVKFVNTLFDTVNLESVDFEGATFENVIFVGTDVSKAMNLDLTNQDVQIFDEMPELEMSKELEKAVQGLLKNEFVKYARVLDTKEGQVSAISVMRLLEQFDEATLIEGLKKIKKSITQDFCTLNTITEAIEAVQTV
ncbi:MAG: pentapeptide repeat-containing protein [Cellulosilyticaceae bacterium]